MTLRVSEAYRQAKGPVLVLGASGFIGASLFRRLRSCRHDVFGTSTHWPNWRLSETDQSHIRVADLRSRSNLEAILNELQPQTVINCLGYGGYSFQTDVARIYETNFSICTWLVDLLSQQENAVYIHCGSSSEYGTSVAHADEQQMPTPNSHYAAAKAAATHVLYYAGCHQNLHCANMRLFSVYGPLEDAARLIPQIILSGRCGQLPTLVAPDIARDFVYIDDACDAILAAAVNLDPNDYGTSFNIGSGTMLTLADIASHSRRFFKLEQEPSYTYPARSWDLTQWVANPQKSKNKLNWQTQTSFEQGFSDTFTWLENFNDDASYQSASKQRHDDESWSISAVIACYKDGPAIGEMYHRITATLRELDIDYEIIFVNDNSPDDCEAQIQKLSAQDPHVRGISHSRNFGSQAAFRSGMEVATKRAVVLLDGDLQDPPELIKKFFQQWKNGNQVVYGRRSRRAEAWFLSLSFRIFYRVFNWFSYLEIPRDAGDFALLDRCVVRWMLQFKERDSFLRGIRAYVGFQQCGVDYLRPKRRHGRSTNSFLRYLAWAKKGILSFSTTPLNALTALGTTLLMITMIAVSLQIAGRLLFPHRVPEGFTSLLVIVMFFGSINCFAIALLGEYIGKIFEEVKARPAFIRRAHIKHGTIHTSTQEDHT